MKKKSLSKPEIADKQQPLILTNMAFWQSLGWTERVDSIYETKGITKDPQPYSPLKEALILWTRRNNYDVILTMGARESFLYGLLCLISLQRSKQIMTEVFIDRENPRNLLWKLKTAIFSKIAKRSIGILTNSQSEINEIRYRWKLSSELIRYVPMHTTIENPHLSPQKNNYILSAGRSGRDFKILIEAIQNTPCKITIICGNDSIEGPDLPSQITIHREVSKQMYLTLLKEASFVVVPLQPSSRSTGQLVVLEAMSFGKAVIATNVTGTRDIIDHEINGILVPAGNADILKEKIMLLSTDSNLRHKLGRAALQKINTEFSIARHTDNKLKAINELATNRTHQSRTKAKHREITTYTHNRSTHL